MSKSPALELRNISKSFGHIKALKNVNFSVQSGEIHALVGENGAGKSTLMNIADGILRADTGEIYLEGAECELRSPLDAQRLGIGLVHQEISLCPDVSVAENIFMAVSALSSRWFTNRAELEAKARTVINKLAPIPVTTPVQDLSVAEQQLVEIAKALALDCKILIFDEPTAALTEKEAEILFGLMREFREQGIAQVYISHRMAEIFDLCDRITVFRDGEHISTRKIGDITVDEVFNDLVGRKLEKLYPEKKDQKKEDTILSVRGLSDGRDITNVSFDVYRNEVLGFGGLIGSGRTELAELVCGIRGKQAGQISFGGKEIPIRSYADSIDHGIVYLSEDRKGSGLFLELPICQNISALDPRLVSKRGLLDAEHERSFAQELAQRVGIKYGSIQDPVSTLSGGNQQKVAIARLLSVKPKLVFLDEPTRGVDVGAKAEIYHLIRELADQGTGVVVISSELPELIGLCDRIAVMHEGSLVGDVSSTRMSEENVIRMASGFGLDAVN